MVRGAGLTLLTMAGGARRQFSATAWVAGNSGAVDTAAPRRRAILTWFVGIRATLAQPLGGTASHGQLETTMQAANPSQASERRARKFPIVCVGGSAGGLDAYIRLLKCLPSDLGVAIVIVNHITLFPTQLHTILPSYTTMPVDLISDRLTIEPNRVFIIPENRDLHVDDGEFHLKPISKPRGWPDVITVFLRSLTSCWDGKLIAVIVSGYDGDGAAALRRIKEVGGITIAQKLSTAAQPDMPQSAIDTGYIDFVLAPEDIALEIRHIASVEA